MRSAGRAVDPSSPGARRRLEQLGEQLVAGSSTAGGELVLSQQSPQPPQPDGVGPADRREDEVGGPDRVDDVGLAAVLGAGDRDALLEQVQQRSHRALVAHRRLGAAGLDRHPGLTEQATHRVGAPRSADDDGHVGPRHALDEVGPAQQGRDVRRLLGGRPQQRDLDGAACRVVRRRRHPSLLAAAESADAPGHPVGHSGHRRAEPVRAVEDDGLALVAVVEQVEEARRRSAGRALPRRGRSSRRRGTAGRRRGRSGRRRRGRRGGRPAAHRDGRRRGAAGPRRRSAPGPRRRRRGGCARGGGRGPTGRRRAARRRP